MLAHFLTTVLDMLGELAQLSRVHEYEKTYWIMVEGDPDPDKLIQLERGIQLKHYLTLLAKVRLISEPDLPTRSKPVTPHGPTSWIEIKLRVGKKRQIRHMTAAVGLPTLRLIRVAIGSLRLGSLEPGHWRNLTMKEVEELKNQQGKAKKAKSVSSTNRYI